MNLQGLRIHVHTLGCRLNQYESESLESRFLAAGCIQTDQPGEAEICLVNTCTITNKADRKTRNTVSRLRRDLGSKGLLVITGCYVENHPGQFDQDESTILVDNQHKSRIFDLVEAHLAGESAIPGKGPEGNPVSPSGLRGDLFDYPESGETRRVRSFLKIQDGCDQFCTYCIVPHVRGRATSRPARDILANAGDLLSRSYQELVLTGVNISRYRDPDGRGNFSHLVRSLLDLPGDWGLRIASMEPELMDQTFLDLVSHPRLKPHLHLCLQSGSDPILKAMGRGYTSQEFMDILDSLRRVNPDFAVSTDLICGFPGETEEDFRRSLDFITRAGFSRVHVFPFSPREGTQAASMDGQLDRGEILRRAKEATGHSLIQEKVWLQRFAGKTVSMLCEKAELHGDRLVLEGHTPQFDLLRKTDRIPAGQENGFNPENWRRKHFDVRVAGIAETREGLVLESAD